MSAVDTLFGLCSAVARAESVRRRAEARAREAAEDVADARGDLREAQAALDAWAVTP